MVPSFIIIDKPVELTSHDVIQHVRRMAGIRQVGHTGTLDPFASGLLIVLLGKATRLNQYLHALPKTYEATLTLGATSDTEDLTGTITALPNAPQPTLAEVERVIQKFIGRQEQIPPIYSAIKKSGEKLYDYARSGRVAEALQLAGEHKRTIEIYALELIEYTYPSLKIRIACSTGTYIRSLGRDIGIALDTGAYVSTLRRTAIGHIKIEKSTSLNEIQEGTLSSAIQPIEKLINFLPFVTLSKDNVAKLKQGKELIGQYSLPHLQPIALFNEEHTLFGLGLYHTQHHTLSPKLIF